MENWKRTIDKTINAVFKESSRRGLVEIKPRWIQIKVSECSLRQKNNNNEKKKKQIPRKQGFGGLWSWNFETLNILYTIWLESRKKAAIIQKSSKYILQPFSLQGVTETDLSKLSRGKQLIYQERGEREGVYHGKKSQDQGYNYISLISNTKIQMKVWKLPKMHREECSIN